MVRHNTQSHLAEIENKIKMCKRCELWKFKKNYVPGEGNPNAKIVFIGEAPGSEEDKQGRPFVGSAGKYLTQVMEKFGIKREEVYITNVLKCRPPNNRDPTPTEIEACKPYLMEQLEAIKPSIIVCLGRFSASVVFNLFGLKFSSISKVRGEVFEVRKWNKNVKIIPLYHPAAVLYKPHLKETFERDFKKIIDLINERKIKHTTLSDFIQ
ncbi:MAG TPA: uracil-DNA glycosylase [Archaeoglobus profundus]|nr:uracil-DNA glycosylase [Archaeoglobus profundus]